MEDVKLWNENYFDANVLNDNFNPTEYYNIRLTADTDTGQYGDLVATRVYDTAIKYNKRSFYECLVSGQREIIRLIDSLIKPKSAGNSILDLADDDVLDVENVKMKYLGILDKALEKSKISENTWDNIYAPSEAEFDIVLNTIKVIIKNEYSW